MDLRRQFIRPVQDVFHQTRRQVRRFVTSPATAIAHMKYRALVKRHDWAGLRASLRSFGEQALRANDTRFLADLGQAAWRLDEYQLGIELVYAAHERSGGKQTDWRGEDLSGATLVVDLADRATRAVVSGVNLVGYIRAAGQRAARTIVVCEPRMVPLFARSLPEALVLPSGADLAPHAGGRVVTADIVDLQYFIGFDADTIARLRAPIVADAEVARAIRHDYLRGRDMPLIGIAWWSSHTGKDLPSLGDWRQLLDAIPAQFVSLQYGDVSNDVAELRGGNPERLIVDPTVDQMKDMDRFASQIAALDLVITISNSGAHLAGSMGQRMILVRDDLFRRSWPYLSQTVPWHAHTAVIGKDERPWDETFAKVAGAARETVRTAR